jgi:hypothetical protein
MNGSYNWMLLRIIAGVTIDVPFCTKDRIEHIIHEIEQT